MNPCKIKPASLESLISAKSPSDSCCSTSNYRHHDDELTLNRMLSMADSRITDYFYGMFKHLRALDFLATSEQDAISTKSLGEVAYSICRLCGDTMQQSSDFLEFSEEAQQAILAFMRPLSHLAFFCATDESPIPPSEWKKPDCERALPRLGKSTPLFLEQDCGSYFEDHFVARKRDNPETRLMHAFSFSACKYYDAVRTICGQSEVFERALRPFQNSRDDLLILIQDLVLACKGRLMLPPSDFELDVDEPEPSLEREAYNALYALFIRPFALIHIEYEPLKRYIESVNARR